MATAVRNLSIDLGHGGKFNIPPDNGCWVHPTCLECPRETCVHDDPVNHTRPSLSESAVRRQAILRRFEAGESMSAIARSMGAKYNTVLWIIRRNRGTEGKHVLSTVRP